VPNVPAGSLRSVVAMCPAGTVATGGGVDSGNRYAGFLTSHAPVYAALPDTISLRGTGTWGPADGWNGTVRNDGGDSTALRTAAICAPLAGTITIVRANPVPGGSTYTNWSITCPEGMFALGGGVEGTSTADVLITGNEPLLRNNPPQIRARATGLQEFAQNWLGGVVNFGSGDRTFTTAGICAVAAANPAVVEFYNADLDNYFITADAVEQASVDSGAVGHWTRTGRGFNTGGINAVCRFYGNASVNPATGRIFGPNSHFYTASESECAGLVALYTPTAPSWHLESRDFHSTPLNADGTCPFPTTPVYRAYNNGFARHVDSNHRLSTSLLAIDEVVARGWIREGIVMCVPG